MRRGSGGGLAGRRRAHRYGDDLLLPHRHPLPHHVPGNILPYIFITTGYGSLLNKFGKTFTNRYLPPKVEQLALESEWNKMLLSYAVQSEILAGRGAKDGGVYFSLPNHPAEILEELYTDLPPLKTGMYADIMKIFEAGRSLTIEPRPTTLRAVSVWPRI